MPDAVLTIDTPEGPIEIPIAGLDLDGLKLSDSRAQMTDFKKIAKTLGLSEDSSEETILAKIADRAEVQSLDAEKIAKALGIEDTDEAKIVAKASELAGKKVIADDEVPVKQSDLDELKANAAKGAKAADELKQSKFDSAFQKALDEVRIDAKDETKVRLQKLYDLAPVETLEQLDAMPKLANTGGKGSGKGASDVPEGQDEERTELDQEVRAYMADHDGVTYEIAIDKVLAERSHS